MKPMDIENKSLEIITAELGDTNILPQNLAVVKRVIHTTADFDYATNLCFHDDACKIAIDTLKQGATIVTDTTMVMAGINKPLLAKLGGEVFCFVADPDVAQTATERNLTRSAVAVEKASLIKKPLIYAVGNAPTALIKLNELISANKITPALIIGVPVGFVNVVESKNLIMQSGVPYIVAKGRKGGSNVAAAIINSLLYQIAR